MNLTKELKKEDIVKIKEKSKNDLYLISKYRTVIMGFASLLVLFFHTGMPVFVNIPMLYNIEKFIKITGYYGVDIFIFLSGIGVTYSIEKNNMREFYYKRVKRILIPFFITTIALAIYEKWTILTFIRRVSFYDFFTKNIYSVLWFIPAIVTMYIIFPLYYKLFKHSKNKFSLTIIIISIICILLAFFSNNIRSDLFGFVIRIPVFLVGILFGWIIKNKQCKLNIWTYVTFFIALIMVLHLVYLINFKQFYIIEKTTNLFLPNIAIPVLISIVISKICDLTIRYNNFILKMLTFFGTISLELYCVQELLYKIIFKKYIITIPFIANMIILIATTLCAMLLSVINKKFWKVFENFIRKGSGKNENNSTCFK